MLYAIKETPDSFKGEGAKRYCQRHGRPSWRPSDELDFEAWVEDSILASIRRCLPALHMSVVEASGFDYARRENAVDLDLMSLRWTFRDGTSVWATVTRSRAGMYHVYWDRQFCMKMNVAPQDERPLSD